MFKKLATSLGLASPDPPPASVIAQFGKQQLKIEFEPDQDYEDMEKGVRVGFLRNKISEAVHQAAENVTLVHGGRKLTDDNQFLIDCGVKTDAKILAIVSSKKDTAKAARRVKIKGKPVPAPVVKPKTPNERIQEVVDEGKKLQVMVEEFEAKTVAELGKEKMNEEHHKLSELVLQKMFALDDVDVAEDEELRKFRKETINTMHNLHKRVDVAFEQKKDELYKPAEPGSEPEPNNEEEDKSSNNA